MHSIWLDVRNAARVSGSSRPSPAWPLALALGIGSVTTMFSVIHGS